MRHAILLVKEPPVKVFNFTFLNKQMNKKNLKFDSAEFVEFESIPIWDMTSPEIKPPTRYFAICPIGIGTAEVESLCSYVKRLAEAHCVSPTRILFPSEDEHQQFESMPYHIRKGSMSAKAARAINGIAVTAETSERIISKATAMPDIQGFPIKLENKVINSYFLE